MVFVTVILIIIEAALIVISNFCRIPEWLSIVLGCVLIADCVFLLRSDRSKSAKSILLSLSAMSILWAVFSAYALPYWNSIIIRDMIGMPYPPSRELEEPLSAEEAREDWDFALKQLRKVHPAVLEEAEKKDALRRIRLRYAEADTFSVHQLYQQLQTLAASFHDAHTEVFPVSVPRLADYSVYGEILAVNGVDREDFASAFGQYISSETPEWTRQRILNGFHSYMDALLFGLLDTDSLVIDFAAADKSITRKTFRKEDFHPVRSHAAPSLSSDRISMYAFDGSLSCGILTLENCYYYTPAQRRKFNRGMKDFFRQMRDRGCKRLVIDVRNNPGGNGEIVRELFRYFPGTVYQMGARYHRRGAWMSGGKRSCRNRPRRDLCFQGEVFVLTSLSTFSAAMHLADYLQGNHLATIVGEAPGNTPTCYTDITHFVLPHSQLSLSISTGRFIRTDSSQEENILTPDIPCPAHMAYETLKQLFRHADQGL